MDDTLFRKRLRLEYFIACTLAVSAALTGLFSDGSGEASLFINAPALVGFIAFALGATALFFFSVQRKRVSSENEPVIPISSTRMVKMSFLWYGLSVVLAFAIIRTPLAYIFEPAQIPPSTTEWIMATVGLGICIVAVWRSTKMYKSKFFDKGRQFDLENQPSEEGEKNDEQPESR